MLQTAQLLQKHQKTETRYISMEKLGRGEYKSLPINADVLDGEVFKRLGKRAP